MSISVQLHDPLLGRHPTINPYRHAANLVWNRLCWDLDWRSWISRYRLKQWKNLHAGRKAVIVCNGPSLLKTDWSELKHVFTFGLNKINLLFEKTDWRPSCVVTINGFVLEQNADFYNQTDLPLFLHARAKQLVQFRPNVVFLHSSDQLKLARDCSISINEGQTVTVAALQLAFHMGFSSVALVGCDHNFAHTGPANATVQSGSRDESHFDARYFSGGMKWQLPDLVASEYYYHLAGDIFRVHGRSITNCTVGGLLELYPRMELSEWLKVGF